MNRIVKQTIIMKKLIIVITVAAIVILILSLFNIITNKYILGVTYIVLAIVLAKILYDKKIKS